MNSFGVKKSWKLIVLLTILGVAAGILILTGWVDQIYKGYKSKSLKDVSSFLMIFISAGAILWLIYGIIVMDVFIIGTNIAAIVLMLIVLTMKSISASFR